MSLGPCDNVMRSQNRSSHFSEYAIHFGFSIHLRITVAHRIDRCFKLMQHKQCIRLYLYEIELNQPFSTNSSMMNEIRIQEESRDDQHQLDM